jgi:hypothetical protein
MKNVYGHKVPVLMNLINLILDSMRRQLEYRSIKARKKSLRQLRSKTVIYIVSQSVHMVNQYTYSHGYQKENRFLKAKEICSGVRRQDRNESWYYNCEVDSEMKENQKVINIIIVMERRRIKHLKDKYVSCPKQVIFYRRPIVSKTGRRSEYFFEKDSSLFSEFEPVINSGFNERARSHLTLYLYAIVLVSVVCRSKACNLAIFAIRSGWGFLLISDIRVFSSRCSRFDVVKRPIST